MWEPLPVRGSPNGQEACEARKGRNVSKSHPTEGRGTATPPQGTPEPALSLESRGGRRWGCGRGWSHCWDAAQPSTKEP